MLTPLFIGKFQPLHNGHLSVIEKGLEKYGNLLIGIGSSEKHHTAEYPFTFDERKLMIERSLASNANYRIVPIPDINDYSKWVEHVESLTGKFDVVYTGNSIVKELFMKKNYHIEQIVEEIYISSSAIRDMIARGFDEWKNFVPEAVYQTIVELNGEQRIRSLVKHYLNPSPAVDTILKYQNGIVLVLRENGQYAIPGGFQEFGDTLEYTAIKECKEETSLDIEIEKLFNVYSDPKRDPRTHVDSIVFIARGHGELNAGDDAEGTIVVDPNIAVKMDLYADHNKILQDYIQKELK